MANEKTTSPEMSEIKDDLASLKSHVEALTNRLKNEGLDQADKLGEKAKEKLYELKGHGQQGLKTVEAQVQAKPAQSLAIAFAVGFLANMLLRRRG
ncbi:YqjD family protein [Sneathiella sp.]|uniref:DUF883 family protein n=1 Tax=Sneathiella sp. TaxID=1964365 RepID=UPI003561D8EA